MSVRTKNGSQRTKISFSSARFQNDSRLGKIPAVSTLLLKRMSQALRACPIGSKHSTTEPSGSILRCHSLHAAEERCFLSCTLIIMAPRISGSIAGTSSGGDGVGVPRFYSDIQMPQMTGDVSIPFANTVRTPPGPGMPR